MNSKRAHLEIDQVIEDLPDTDNNRSMAITRNDAGGARLWTFGGTRANRSIAKQIQSLVEVRRVDAIGLDLKTPLDPRELSADLLATELLFSAEEIKDLAKPIKFSECLPASLLLQIIRMRQFEQPVRALYTGLAAL